MRQILFKVYIFIFIILSNLNGQYSSIDEPITINQGLSQNLVYCIYQDHDGYIWFGTKDGLNKFDGYEFKIYRHEPDDKFSLSNNEIRAITQDDVGNFWIGTFGGGLNKFNPLTEKFTSYRSDLNDPTTLTGNLITDIVFDNTNNESIIWIATTNGFNRFRTNSSINERFFPDSLLGIGNKNKFVRAIAKDKKGGIRIGLMDGGLYYFDYDDKQLKKAKCENTFSEPIITCLTVDDKGTLWTGTNDGIFHFDEANQSLVRINGSDKYFGLIKAILADGNKIYYSNFLTPALLYVYNLSNDSLSVFCDVTSLFASTNSGRIISLLNDNSGNIWIGTNGNGVIKKNAGTKKFENYLCDSNDKNKLSFSSTRSIYEDQEGNIWIGGYGGLDKLNVRTGKITTAKFARAKNQFEKRLPFLAVFSINHDPKNKNVLWLSDLTDGLIVYNTLNSSYKKIYGSDDYRDNTFYGKEVYDMKYDEDGNLWLGTNKGLSKYDISSGKFVHYYSNADKMTNFPLGQIRDILIDFPHGVWIGTDTGGFSLVDPSSNYTIRYLHNPDLTNSVSSNKVLCIQKDRKGNLWIGTDGSGLNKFNVVENRFKRFTTKSGLPNNVVYSILEDSEGYLWLSTNNGLSKFDPVNETFKNYDYDNGLQSNEFNFGAFLKTRNGKLFFGGIKGVTSFFPGEIKDSKFNPPVVITKLLLSNKPVPLNQFLTIDGKLELSYKDNIFSFQFASLDYSNPVKNKYSYRLKGFKDEWLYTDASRRQATFTNIDPGLYTLEVKATNADGVWSDKILSLSIVIIPPFWDTIWFKLSFVFLFLLLTYLLYRKRINYLETQKAQKEKFTQQLIESQENERKRIAKELHDAVGQDLLIIKNLSSLALQKKDDSAKNGYLNDISDKSQKAIDDVRQISRNLRPYLIDRLGLTKAIEAMIDDLGKVCDIVFHFHSNNIDNIFSSYDEIHIYRIIQESVNNIIKHSKAAEAVITLILEHDSLLITIKDDGVGIQSDSDEKSIEQKYGFGLSGILERIRIMNGKIEIKSPQNNGTNIFITFPICNKKPYTKPDN
ncbi:MAG: two-component regulator propeller domain-containing protein [Ignavibacteria bacterium]|nr:two-component regulator propeller domain-containing protein [Ignavibacteria bacterium]